MEVSLAFEAPPDFFVSFFFDFTKLRRTPTLSFLCSWKLNPYFLPNLNYNR